MMDLLEGGYLQSAHATTSKELRAILEMLLKLFLIRKQQLAMRAGFADFNTITLEVIDSLPERTHFLFIS